MEGKIFGVNLALIILVLALLIPLGLLGIFNLRETMNLKKEFRGMVLVTAPVVTPSPVVEPEVLEPVAIVSPTPAPKKVKVNVNGQTNTSSTSSSANTIDSVVAQ